jgi:type II secretory pathway pseudopilin PulG
MMSATTTIERDRTLTLPRVVTLLAGILVLAIVLPYGAVQTLHVRRLQAADAAAQAIADRVDEAIAAGTFDMPPGTEVLIGPGDQPRAMDERWGGTATFSLMRALRQPPAIAPDPWGNAFLVNVGSSPGGPRWVVSAGPDGILQTPLSGADRAAGDDRIASIR